MPAGKVDNAEPAVSEGCVPVLEKAEIIRPAMRNRIRHAAQNAVARVKRRDADKSRDPAHFSSVTNQRNGSFRRVWRPYYAGLIEVDPISRVSLVTRLICRLYPLGVRV